MFKNVAGQFVYARAFNSLGSVTDDGANIDCAVTIDGNSEGSLNAGSVVHLGNGIYRFALTQAETNGDTLLFRWFSSTPGVEVVGMPSSVIYTRPQTAEVNLTEQQESTIVTDVVQAILPSVNVFAGTIDRGTGRRRITVVQRDDHNADDGTAFEWPYVNPSIDFTDTDIVVGAAGGENADGERVTGTGSIQSRDDGSCNIRLEFTSTQLNKPEGFYNFDIHIVRDSRRITTTQIDLVIEPKQADEPS